MLTDDDVIPDYKSMEHPVRLRVSGDVHVQPLRGTELRGHAERVVERAEDVDHQTDDVLPLRHGRHRLEAARTIGHGVRNHPKSK